MEETLEAMLRNQLSPLYGLADMILEMDKHPDLKRFVIEQAKQAIKNKENIIKILEGIEAKTRNKPDIIRKAFYAAYPNKDEKERELAFEDWLKN
jgi:hypothetical protein